MNNIMEIKDIISEKFNSITLLTIPIMLVTTLTYADTMSTFNSDGQEIYASESSRTVSRKSDNYYWYAYDGGKSYAPEWGYVEIDPTTGAKGSDGSLKYTATGGRSNPHEYPEETCGGEILTKQDALDNPQNICTEAGGGFNYYFLNEDRTKGIPEVAGKNRISFYVKLPKEFTRYLHHSGEPENYTINFGTYTRDPNGSYDSGANLGRHFYHWMNFKGTGDYWTKVIIDEHPQHEVGGSSDPGSKPTESSGYGYIAGLTRFYFKIAAKHLLPNPWAVWIDEFETYHDPRPMPPKIATITLTQVGSDDFEIDFASIDEGGGSEYVNSFEIRYSSNPINDANFYDAEIVSGSPAITGDYERYAHAEAYDLNINGNTVYFAIRQTDENTNAIAYAEYDFQHTDPKPSTAKAPPNIKTTIK